MKKSPLHHLTQSAGAVMGEWQGWELPLSYDNPEKEYSAAKISAAIYDASAIGRPAAASSHGAHPGGAGGARLPGPRRAGARP